MQQRGLAVVLLVAAHAAIGAGLSGAQACSGARSCCPPACARRPDRAACALHAGLFGSCAYI